jgi:hypothetical protein
VILANHRIALSVAKPNPLIHDSRALLNANPTSNASSTLTTTGVAFAAHFLATQMDI